MRTQHTTSFADAPRTHLRLQVSDNVPALVCDQPDERSVLHCLLRRHVGVLSQYLSASVDDDEPARKHHVTTRSPVVHNTTSNAPLHA